ncbi:DUF3558 family protein [Corynebacterium yudongzhengii]|uniref:DUF3558 family protein n=1 Tax=Corynebacterium yudongzhengii TaxID=2080740 RepID=UPI001304ECCF|nr:DUF3558 family protein [Corynebacterium yudongzhengii]
MNRLIATIVATVVGSLVAACGLTGASVPGPAAQDTTDSTDETQPQELPPGFYLSGEFVELTEFDPEDPGLEPIRACEEITPEAFHEMGLELVTGEQLDSFGMTGCGVRPIDSSGSRAMISLTAGPSQVDGLVDRSAHHEWSPTPLLEDFVLLQYEHDIDSACAVSTDTSRGLLSVTYNDYSSNRSNEELCGAVIDVTEAIYQQLRGREY